MKQGKKYIPLESLEVYQLARELSKISWVVYEPLDWQTKKVLGDQFIRSIDSIGANIAEGYGRYHYLEKIKFFYNARASLAEATNHWTELLKERGKIDIEKYRLIKDLSRKSSIKLRNFIATTYKAKNEQK